MIVLEKCVSWRPLVIRQYDPEKMNIWQLPYGIGIEQQTADGAEMRPSLSALNWLRTLKYVTQ